MNNLKSSKPSFEEEPILGLLDLPIQEMNQEELKKFILHIRNLRTINQGLHNRLERESGKQKAKKSAPTKVQPKINLAEYEDMA